MLGSKMAAKRARTDGVSSGGTGQQRSSGTGRVQIAIKDDHLLRTLGKKYLDTGEDLLALLREKGVIDTCLALGATVQELNGQSTCIRLDASRQW